ncbi:Bre2 protein [Martiniozyma asiatica (nom. inval.)]|nr:Bre2 protein [Martiniozyma asiatica]
MGKKINVIPRFKPVPYTLSDLESKLTQPTLIESHSIQCLPSYAQRKNEEGQDKIQLSLFTTPDLPHNRRGYKYNTSRPCPYMPSLLYATSDLPPHNVRFSYFDRSSSMSITSDLGSAGVPPSSGWKSTRGAWGIREGTWYVEFYIRKGISSNTNTNTNTNGSDPHVRVGWARLEAALEAPVGYDGYGYGLRDKLCEIVHLSKRSPLGNVDLKEGDVIGLLITLPSISIQKEISEKEKARNNKSSLNLGIIRDMIPIKYKNCLFFEQYEYTSSTEMEHLLNPVTVFGEHAIPDTQRFQPTKLPDSSIHVFHNGVKLSGDCTNGAAWENLLAFLPPASEQKEQEKAFARLNGKLKIENSGTRDDGELGYYPMVSCFNGGVIEINTGKDIWITPEGVDLDKIKNYSERYTEKVVEDVVGDIIDECVSCWLDKKEKEFGTA